MIMAYAINENGDKGYIQRNYTVKEASTTIYYKGYDNPNIHYKIGNGQWTALPGVQMEKCLNLEGYTHKYTIDLAGAENLTACFNDGNGNYDNNSGMNYTFKQGIYAFNDGKISKLMMGY